MIAALVYVVGFCIVAVLVYMGRYSGRLRVTHTRVIDAPPAQIGARVTDLRRWPEWSPWLQSPLDVQTADAAGNDGDAGSCTWSRDGVDIGRIQNLGARDGASLEQRILLKRPFPFRGRASWRFAEVDGRTHVTWSLRGRVAFAMRAFAGTVQGSIALDFRHGLDRLASLVEPPAAPRYAVTYPGVREVAALRYAYVVHEGRIQDLGEAIDRCVSQVRAHLTALGVAAGEDAIGVYIKTDIKRRTTTCRFGVPVGVAEVDGLDVASQPARRAFTARLQGSRAQLEVAWYLVMQRLGAEGFQPDLRVAPFERYLDLANAPDDNATVTELHIAIR